MTSNLMKQIVAGWMEAVQADPDAIRRKDPDLVLKHALEAALINYSRKKDNCFELAVGEFLDEEGEYYSVSARPQSTKHRKEITLYDAVMRVAGGKARRVPKNTYEWRALRLALYPEMNLTMEEDDVQDS